MISKIYTNYKIKTRYYFSSLNNLELLIHADQNIFRKDRYFWNKFLKGKLITTNDTQSFNKVYIISRSKYIYINY
jgi:hypothetical protein